MGMEMNSNELKVQGGINEKVLQDLISHYNSKGDLSEIILVTSKSKFQSSIERRFDWSIHLSQFYVNNIHMELYIYYVDLIRFNFIVSSNYLDDEVQAYPVYEGG